MCPMLLVASDDTQEQVPVKEIVTAHSVFPTCICQVGLKLLDKLDDAESHSGTTGLSSSLLLLVI